MVKFNNASQKKNIVFSFLIVILNSPVIFCKIFANQCLGLNWERTQWNGIPPILARRTGQEWDNLMINRTSWHDSCIALRSCDNDVAKGAIRCTERCDTSVSDSIQVQYDNYALISYKYRPQMFINMYLCNTIYDIWYAIYDIWFMIYGMWYVIHDIWHMIMIYDVSYIWYMIHDIRYMVYDIWTYKHMIYKYMTWYTT